MEPWYIEAAKQIPALSVLTYLTTRFLIFIKESRTEEKAMIEKILFDSSAERVANIARIEAISSAAHTMAEATKDKFITSLHTLDGSLTDLRTLIASKADRTA